MGMRSMKGGEGAIARRTVVMLNIPRHKQFLLERRKALHCNRER